MKDRKHALMFITHDLALGGLQQVIVNLCSTIDRATFEVSVLCLRHLGEFAPVVAQMGIPVFLLPQKHNGTDYFSFIKVAHILRREKIDIIHTHNTQPFIDGTIGALLSGVHTIIHTDHARDFPDKKRYMIAEWAMSHFAYRIVGVSDHTSQNLIKYEKISPRKIITIMNGLDESRYAITIDKDKKKAALGLTTRGPIIGLAVRLTTQKGITYLLHAMPEVITQCKEVTLIIAGQGPLEGSLKKEAASLGITNHVLFLGPRTDIPELLKLFDLYVLPSLWEGLPMVVLEAMASGCPIIATNVGGVTSAITHGENGSLIEPRDPSRLAAEIITLLRNRDIRNRYIHNGYKRFRETFTAQCMTTKYEALYLSKR